MAAKINPNRYRLITLLYVIFVCISVLNIPASLIDSNIYSIKTYEYLEKGKLRQVEFADKIIKSNQEKLITDTATSFMGIVNKLENTYTEIDKIDGYINSTLKEMGTTVVKEFNSKRKMEEVFTKDSMVFKLKFLLLDLSKFLAVQKIKLNNPFDDLIPLTEMIKTQSGKETEWERYLFLHKPAAISYNQFKRIKLLLLEYQFEYQNKLLGTIDISQVYYSSKTKEITQNTSTLIQFSANDLPNVKKEQSNDDVNLKKADNELSLNKKADYSKPETDKLEFDKLFQQIISSLRTENLFVGINNIILNDFNLIDDNRFQLTISPVAELNKSGKNYTVKFNKTGEYFISFYDVRNSNKTLLFEKKIIAVQLPKPSIKLNIDNSSRESITQSELFNVNRLISTIDLSNGNFIQNKINGYRISRYNKSGESLVVYNYGEIFQPTTQSLINKLQNGDVIIFDNITVSLPDGTTRTPNSIIYKISN